MALKQILDWIVPIFTAGACLVIGFLAFSGMYALWPLYAVCLVLLILTVIYEWQVYKQNIYRAFEKFLGTNYLPRQLAKEYLRELLPEIELKNSLIEIQQKLERIALKNSLLEILQKLEQTDDIYPDIKQDYKAFLKAYKTYQKHPLYLNQDSGLPQTLNLEPNLSTIKKTTSDEIKAYKIQLKNELNTLLEAFELEKPDDSWSGLNQDYETFFKAYRRHLLFLNQDNPLLQTLEPKLSLPTNKASQAEVNTYTSQLKHELNALLGTFEATNNYPDFMDDYMKLMQLHHQYDHPNLKPEALQNKEKIEKNLEELQEFLASELLSETPIDFPSKIGKHIHVLATRAAVTEEHLNHWVLIVEDGLIYSITKKGPTKSREQIAEHRDPNDRQGSKIQQKFNFKKPDQDVLKALYNDLGPDEKKCLDVCLYRASLRTYLAHQRPTWQSKLTKRTWFYRATLALSTLAGIFMIIGTTYLLLDAFMLIPVLSSIPFGILPGLIVPMAIIAGSAWGLLTYNAITDLLNDNLLIKRFNKIKADFNQGHVLKPLLMLTITVSLLTLTIALSICSAGTWWTVIKQGRPLFFWMSKIPAALIIIIAGVLGIAAMAFNGANIAETVDEADQEPADHPYDLHLLTIQSEEALEDIPNRPTLIKCGETYWVQGSHDNGQTWKTTKISAMGLDGIPFNRQILRYSFFYFFYTRVYLNILWHQCHTFIFNPDNWGQTLNPFRAILNLTFYPLVYTLFSGHLAGDSVIGDKLPGVPPILAAILGFIAALVADWHYYFSFEHAHENDIGSLMDEYEHGKREHSHTDDLPTQLLKFLFTPLFYAAAWWDSSASERKKEATCTDTYYEWWVERIYNTEATVGFDEAWYKYRNEKAPFAPNLSGADVAYVEAAAVLPEELDQETSSQSLPVTTPILPPATGASLVVFNLATMHRDKTVSVVKNSLFRPCGDLSCSSHPLSKMAVSQEGISSGTRP